MAQSSDPRYQTAIDLMMRPVEVCRARFSVRHLPWQGEKAALRHLEEHDPDYLALLRECLGADDRGRKVELYERLVSYAIAPTGPLWTPGITAVYLADPAEHATRTETALAFWESLFAEEAAGAGARSVPPIFSVRRARRRRRPVRSERQPDANPHLDRPAVNQRRRGHVVEGQAQIAGQGAFGL